MSEEELRNFVNLLQDYVDEIDHWEDQKTTEGPVPTEEEWERVENAQKQEEKWEHRLAFFVQAYLKNVQDGLSATVDCYKEWDRECAETEDA